MWNKKKKQSLMLYEKDYIWNFQIFRYNNKDAYVFDDVCDVLIGVENGSSIVDRSSVLRKHAVQLQTALQGFQTEAAAVDFRSAQIHLVLNERAWTISKTNEPTNF